MQGRYPRSLVAAAAYREFEDAEPELRRKGLIHDRDILDLIRIQSSCAFFANLEQTGQDPVYHGDRVGPGDFDQVLLRWRLDDDQYRVVFGDLRTEDVSAARLAELEER
jgi:hypothetical protein